MSYNHLSVTRGGGGRFRSFVQEEMERIRNIESDPDHRFWLEKMRDMSAELAQLVGDEERKRRVEEAFPGDDFTYRDLYTWYKLQVHETRIAQQAEG